MCLRTSCCPAIISVINLILLYPHLGGMQNWWMLLAAFQCGFKKTTARAVSCWEIYCGFWDFFLFGWFGWGFLLGFRFGFFGDGDKGGGLLPCCGEASDKHFFQHFGYFFHGIL